jgi:hypothetical protein
MRIAFQATEAAFEADECAIVCGFAGTDADGAEHYLTFQRSPEGEAPGEDWGVHLEFDDQINGQYERIRACRLSRDRLSVDLSQQLGSLAGVEGFDLALAIDDSSFEQVRVGLPRIFREMPSVLLTA